MPINLQTDNEIAHLATLLDRNNPCPSLSGLACGLLPGEGGVEVVLGEGKPVPLRQGRQHHRVQALLLREVNARLAA